MSSINRIAGQTAASTYIQNADAASNAAGAQQQAKTSHTQRGHRAADQVTLSDAARQMAAAHDAVKAAPDVRQDKVDAIKQQIDSGTYQVSAHVLARKMVDAANQ
jgi:negative regulator of flagellin synthesis FlgM